MSVPESSDRLDVRRWYDAPPDVVFRAFTEAKWLERWFCPSTDVTLSVVSLDVKVGGKYRFRFLYPGDRVAMVVGEYRAITRPNHLAFTWTWDPPDPHAGVETLVTVDFREDRGGTELILRHAFLPTEALSRQHEAGWKATLDRLQSILRGHHAGH